MSSESVGPGPGLIPYQHVDVEYASQPAIDLRVLIWAEKVDWRPAGPAPVHCFLSQ